MTVYFVGAGPGAPELVTARGAELLARADVRIEEGSAPLADLVQSARDHATVVRLVKGCPTESPAVLAEIRAIAAAGVAYEVVPGITAAGALAAYTGLDAWNAELLVADADAAAVATTATELLEEGRNPATTALVAVDLTRPTQRVRVGTLADIATRARGLRAESMLFAVGDALDGEALTWFTAQGAHAVRASRPLLGKRVLVTRTREQASGTAQLLREAGAEPVIFPTIAIHPSPEPEKLAAAIETLAGLGEPGDRYTWVAFTSANAVDATWREIARQGRDARVFGGAKLAVVGPATAAALRAHGLEADVVAKEQVGEALAAEMQRAFGADTATRVRVLLPRAKEAREVLPEMLRAAGCVVDIVAAYETRPPEPDAVGALVTLLVEKRVDAALFTSSSTVTNLCDLLGDQATLFLRGVVLASIGPVTTTTLQERGLRADVRATEYTLKGLVSALEGFYRTP